MKPDLQVPHVLSRPEPQSSLFRVEHVGAAEQLMLLSMEVTPLIAWYKFDKSPLCWKESSEEPTLEAKLMLLGATTTTFTEAVEYEEKESVHVPITVTL